MKLNFLAVLLTYCSFVFGQSGQDNLRGDFTTYINLTINQDFEKSMDYIVEDFFEVIPKQQLISVFKQLYNNPSMEFKVESPKILSIEPIEKIGDRFYSILMYSNLMKMRLKSEDNDESQEDKKNRIELLKSSFNKKFGDENVTYNNTTDFFEIKVNKKVCCVSKNGSNNWKFITIDSDKKYILQKFIPSKVLNKL